MSKTIPTLAEALRSDPKLLERSFGSRLAPGATYARQGKVGAITHDDQQASAKVQGSRRSPYRSTLRLIVGRSGTAMLAGHCDCPYAVDCKHAAALAWALRKQLGSAEAAPLPTASAPPPAAPSRSTARAAAPRKSSESLPAPWVVWLQTYGQRLAEPAVATPPRAPRPLRFVLLPIPDHGGLRVVPLRGRLGKQGRLTALKPIRIEAKKIVERSADDDSIDRQLLLALDSEIWADLEPGRAYALLSGQEHALKAAVEAGRVHWQSLESPVLQWAPAQPLELGWRSDVRGEQRLEPQVAVSASCVVYDWRFFVDRDSARIGLVDCSALSPLQRSALIRLPAVPPEHVAAVSEALTTLPLKLPRPAAIERRMDPQPARAMLKVHPSRTWNPTPHTHLSGILVEAWVRYGEMEIMLGAPGDEVNHFDGGVLRIRPRDTAYEAAVQEFLKVQGFTRISEWNGAVRWLYDRPLRVKDGLPTWWQQFRQAALALGYLLKPDPALPVQHGQLLGQIDLEILDPEAGSDWFQVRLGVEVDGQRIDLVPLLLAALDQPGAWTAEHLKLAMADGCELLLPRARLEPLLALLKELEQRAGGELAAPRAVLHALEVPADLRLREGAAAQALRRQLAGFAGLQAPTLPPGFTAELRPYQARGVSWLQALRELRFGGVLADDMGLGKTVQVLAHLCIEQAAGRLAQPALVVCPTSVIPNWEAELRRFSPALKLLVFHGLDRPRAPADWRAAEVVLTSYALLARDAELLASLEFSWAIFDEAQWLKNASSKSFAAAAALKARQRLCLTGTPVENHLGELKSQFDLAFPGLLGTHRAFQQRFRGPIEKGGDSQAAAQLKRRIAPFLLRRRKQDVATELPPRSTLLQRIELAGPQRDLYETLRSQMEKRVREALAERGLERARITILDALLKLRQVCCHPALLKLESARAVQTSAKLDALKELLPTLIEEGRSVLLFSQFTSMLDLIEAELPALGIGHVRLDGSTVDRKTPVQRFQDGAVPLFLISLKAGGVGLNLTRADTVILYDPWWNPAVEQQAIDRAHRIGQDKPVFVYELNCVDTVEDRMHTLKQGKRAIADAVLDEGEAALARLSGDELLALFAGG